MSASTATKFSFETEFAADGTILRDGDNWQLNFTREEMDVERDKAYAEGKQDALVAAEEASVAALADFVEQSRQILSNLKKESDAYRAEAIELVLIAARKISSTALDRYPDEQVLDTAREVFKDLRDVPRLVVSCPPSFSADAERKLQDAALQSGLDREALIVRRVEDMPTGDVALEWAQGEVSVNTNDVAERVEKTIRQWLAATETQEVQRDLFYIDTATEEGA